MDTIFAPATARGRSGLAVVRLSGPRALVAAEALAGPLPMPGRALRRLHHGGDVIDEALVLTFAEGASFTGEVVAEFQVHGSAAVLAALLAVLGRMEGLRPAEAGEFTRRAFENERLDLAQVEGLADLIDAETEAQRRQAMRVLSGAIGVAATRWRSGLLRAAALVEAGIDFADEEVPEDLGAEVAAALAPVQAELAAEVAGFSAAERLRDGFEVAIVGRPNVGKSTLLNALARREAAITSEIAGTTRDVIEVRMEISGLPVTLLDTAGLRQAEDAVERIGVARALERAEAADLRVFLLDAAAEVPLMTPKAGDILLQSKADLQPGGAAAGISGLTGAGVPGLLASIAGRLEQRIAGAAVISHARQLAAIARALEALESAADELRAEPQQPELVAERLREAMRALDQLIGRVDVEALLGEIFSSFCIGK